MALFQIKHKITAAVLFQVKCGSLKLAAEAAVAARADLRDADLRDTDLCGARLGGAYLGGADLRDAYLGGADLRGAYLRGAYLGGAYLGGAYLRDADLGGADLGGAYLGGAYLRGAYLGGADLRGAYLGGHKIDGDVGLIEAGTPNTWPAYGFVDQETRALRVVVGCRHFEIGEGRAYWSSEAHPHRAQRREVLAALDYIEAVARLRGWEEKADADHDAAA